MSVDIIVVRGDGARPGPDIEDRLIATIPVAVQRGRNECDGASGLQPVTMTLVLRPDLLPGKIVRVQDALQGATWVGQIVSVSHHVADTATTEIRVLRQA